MPCSQTHSAAPARTRWLEAFTRSQTKQAQQHVSSTASHNHSNHNQKMCMQYPSLAPSTALSCSTPAAQPSRSSSSTVGWQPTLGTTHLAFLSASNDIKLVGRTKSYSHEGYNNFASLPEHELIKTEGTLFAAFFFVVVVFLQISFSFLFEHYNVAECPLFCSHLVLLFFWHSPKRMLQL